MRTLLKLCEEGKRDEAISATVVSVNTCCLSSGKKEDGVPGLCSSCRCLSNLQRQHECSKSMET